MQKVFGTIAAGAALAVFLASAVIAQAPQGAPGGAPAGAPGGGGGGRGGGGGQAPLASPNPIYMSVHLEGEIINKPAAEVWARVGKFCDIGEWMQVGCMLTSGKDGEIGAVRSIGPEILVAKTDLSYTYTQPPRVGAFYDLYHGTVEAKPVTATTSRIIYTLVWDASNLADDAAREARKTQRVNMFTTAVQNMKILAEGGTIPPRGGGRGGGAGAPGGGAPGGGAPGGAGQRRGQ